MCEGLHDFTHFVQEIRKERFNQDDSQFVSEAIQLVIHYNRVIRRHVNKHSQTFLQEGNPKIVFHTQRKPYIHTRLRARKRKQLVVHRYYHEYCQLPNKNSYYISEGYLEFLSAFRRSFLLILSFLSESQTMFYGTLCWGTLPDKLCYRQRLYMDFRHINK